MRHLRKIEKYLDEALTDIENGKPPRPLGNDAGAHIPAADGGSRKPSQKERAARDREAPS